MTKATQALVFFIALHVVWFLILTGHIPTSPRFQEEVAPLLPWWSMVAFGSYALGTLGYDLLTFKDKPKKYAELMQQIEEAKADLKTKGITV
ncbi:Dolichol-phosphate mannosyltransferase subunit 3 [Wickerhamiella sorbophila]|uniref:Dolichol-phosphate mannosyltransferase subunit 3 n=1 Tax=Wickerhamiella sorbophila TaxID=45607 RepID=A0A2T0FEH4_9ASCO|nr:Dolichol-phosphate mannosyltransferase subunit 3 [Wickerhamiella sorbophila]PRT53370.1 Dolichol-phosphate mannosyltransferase subunit 3 [Wickerhamiella sorbophila]